MRLLRNHDRVRTGKCCAHALTSGTPFADAEGVDSFITYDIEALLSTLLPRVVPSGPLDRTNKASGWLVAT